MKKLLAIAFVLTFAVTASAQNQRPGSKYPLYRSPDQKQADFQAAQQRQRYVAPTITIPQRYYWDPYYGYGYPYGRYPYYRPNYYPGTYSYYPSPGMQPWIRPFTLPVR